MEEVIKDIGKMVNNMEKGNSYMMIEKVGKKEIGITSWVENHNNFSIFILIFLIYLLEFIIIKNYNLYEKSTIYK